MIIGIYDVDLDKKYEKYLREGPKFHFVITRDIETKQVVTEVYEGEATSIKEALLMIGCGDCEPEAEDEDEFEERSPFQIESIEDLKKEGEDDLPIDGQLSLFDE